MDGEDNNESGYSSGVSRQSSVTSISSFGNPLNTTNIDAPGGKGRDPNSRFSNSTEKRRGGVVGRLGRENYVRGETRDPVVGRNGGGERGEQEGAKSRMDREGDNESGYCSGVSRQSSVTSISSFGNSLNTTNINPPGGKGKDPNSRFSNSTEKRRGGVVGRLGRGNDVRGETRNPVVGRNGGGERGEQEGAKSRMNREGDNESGYSSGVSRQSSVTSISSFGNSLNTTNIDAPGGKGKDPNSRCSSSTEKGRGGEIGRLGRGDVRGETRDPGIGRNGGQGGAKRNMDREGDNESGYSSGVSRQSSVTSISSFGNSPNTTNIDVSSGKEGESTSLFANSTKTKCRRTAPDGSRFERGGQENVGWNEAPVPKKTSSRAKDHWNDRSFDCLNQRFPDLKKTTAKEGNPCNICQVPVDEAFVYNSPTREFQFHGKCLASFTGG